VVKVLADRNYDSGDRVFMSLGLKSSAECLEDHGFVPKIDVRDCSCEVLTLKYDFCSLVMAIC